MRAVTRVACAGVSYGARMNLRIGLASVTHAPLFAGLLVLLLFGLGLNASRMRVKLRIFRGDGGNPAMAAAERAHGNTVEHALPLMVLLVLLELMGVGKGLIALLGTLIVLARVLRSAGMLAQVRAVGMTGVVMTYLLELVMSVGTISASLRAME